MVPRDGEIPTVITLSAPAHQHLECAVSADDPKQTQATTFSDRHTGHSESLYNVPHRQSKYEAPVVKDIPQGQWFLGRWEEGAATIDAASFRDKQGRWWRAEIDDLGHPVFRIVSDPPVAWARPLPLDKRLELNVSYGVKKAAVAIAQKFKVSKL